ncbi:MAG TPA: CHAT domain-containing protein, partial [Thermoanaerobaculia bacterium]|nr:CHAT domain-containing protein [Thermoanaerobaculia bacterium]
AKDDANVWCDLAAARYTIAIRENDPAQFPLALAAADVALQLNANLAEARFNRALILDHLGLRDQAREQWQSYLAVDGGSSWANESRHHLRQLQPVPSFKEELQRAYERIASDPAAAHAFARKHPGESRRWGGTIILGDWANAERNGNHELAMKHMRIARELGLELARDSGDQMLRSLVAAIDGANEQQRRVLIDAHCAFRDGQDTYKNGEPARATPLLLRAAELFERGNSPCAIVARYYAANTVFDQGRIEEAQATYERLLANTPAQFKGHRAEILWQVGLVHLARGRWGACIASLTDSATIFDRLGEEFQAGSVREILAEAFDRVGNPSAAWNNRLVALRVLGRTMTYRLQLVIASMSRCAVMSRDWRTASSLLSLEIDVAKHIDDPALHVETLIRRARVHVETNRNVAAKDLRKAQMLLSRVPDPGYREHLHANALEVEALIASTPQLSIELLTRALRYHSESGRRMYVPELLFERGRVLLEIDDRDHAAADFEAAIAELETHRESLPGGEDRFGMFHDADELFDAAVATALNRNDPTAAFQYVERARARALLESLGTTWRKVDPAALPSETMVIEYSVHEGELAIFTVTSNGIRVVRRPIDRPVLVRDIDRHTRAASESDVHTLHTVGRSLYEVLIAPIEQELKEVQTLVFVPDPLMARLPFSALVDSDGKYLIEHYPLVVDPSAAVYVQLAHSDRRNTNGKALIFTGAEDLGQLPAAQREASSVASAYTNVTQLSGAAATRGAFMREAANADVIHFVGHAVAASKSGATGYLLLDEELDLKRIAAMKLRKTSLVVLAACATAGGEIRSSEGTISIARAFVAAGVPSVVATLWPIDDDEAAEFFPSIHRNRSRGLSTAEAVRAAQLEMIHRPNASTALWSAV